MVRPSGETSSDIHVPSLVVNDTVRVVARGRPPAPRPARPSCCAESGASAVDRTAARLMPNRARGA